jgi:hypothetical protein
LYENLGTIGWEVLRNLERLYKIKPAPDVPRPAQINGTKSFSWNQQRIHADVRAIKTKLLIHTEFGPDRQPASVAASHVEQARWAHLILD